VYPSEAGVNNGKTDFHQRIRFLAIVVAEVGRLVCDDATANLIERMCATSSQTEQTPKIN
jgi:hypothetical protein